MLLVLMFPGSVWSETWGCLDENQKPFFSKEPCPFIPARIHRVEKETPNAWDIDAITVLTGGGVEIRQITDHQELAQFRRFMTGLLPSHTRSSTTTTLYFVTSLDGSKQENWHVMENGTLMHLHSFDNSPAKHYRLDDIGSFVEFLCLDADPAFETHCTIDSP